MKKTATIVLLSTIVFSSQSHAEGWWDSIKGMLGLSETPAATTTVEKATSALSGLESLELVQTLTENLGVTPEQASGGMGALLNYAKQHVETDKFSALTHSIPGADTFLKSVPDVSSVTESAGGLGGLINKAAEYNESLKSMNDLKNQFEALGLDIGMISSYVAQAKQYLDTPAGQEAKQMLSEAFAQYI